MLRESMSRHVSINNHKIIILCIVYDHRFRDQNFGINDLVAIQDVRNDFNLQDIDDSTVIKDKGECREI